MLVLTRRANQSIVIGGRIVVRVLQVQRDQVRLGIEAPREVEVHREEVFATLEEANRQAATAPASLSEVLGPLASRGTADTPSGNPEGA